MAITKQIRRITNAKAQFNKPEYNPMPEQIRAACAEIQKGCTAWERYRRSGGLERVGEFKWPAPRREVRVDEHGIGEVA